MTDEKKSWTTEEIVKESNGHLVSNEFWLLEYEKWIPLKQHQKNIKEIILKYFRKEGGHYYPQFNSDCEAWTDFVDELLGEQEQ